MADLGKVMDRLRTLGHEDRTMKDNIVELHKIIVEHISKRKDK